MQCTNKPFGVRKHMNCINRIGTITSHQALHTSSVFGLYIFQGSVALPQCLDNQMCCRFDSELQRCKPWKHSCLEFWKKQRTRNWEQWPRLRRGARISCVFICLTTLNSLEYAFSNKKRFLAFQPELSRWNCRLLSETFVAFFPLTSSSLKTPSQQWNQQQSKANSLLITMSNWSMLLLAEIWTN